MLTPLRSGKVRELFHDGDELLIVTTDRLSAFDRILGEVPGKGQILNLLSAWWFERTADLMPNHLLRVVDAQAVVVRETRPLPIEVVVRGYLTGVTGTSIGHLYAQGQREIYGHRFPDGLEPNSRLPEPLVTPTTKAEQGQHDERIDASQAAALIGAERWREVEQLALRLFQRGSELAERAALTLVDTKYEMGIDASGELLLIDEVHTPDSSRFWLEGQNYDKEFLRLEYATRGYRGEGEPPTLPEAVWNELQRRYREVYRRLTGEPFAIAQGRWEQRLGLA